MDPLTMVMTMLGLWLYPPLAFAWWLWWSVLEIRHHVMLVRAVERAVGPASVPWFVEPGMVEIPTFIRREVA